MYWSYFIFFLAPPSVLKFPKDIEVSEGKEFSILVISSDCYPTPKIEWVKDENQIFASEATLLETDNCQHKLSVTSANLSDTGNYKCIISNEFGSTESSTSVKVFGIFVSFFFKYFDISNNFYIYFK